jgi:hypothetical protein
MVFESWMNSGDGSVDYFQPGSSAAVCSCAGRDLEWWKEFFYVVRMMGYNGWESLEMEDFTMSTEAGIRSSIGALQATISRWRTKPKEGSGRGVPPRFRQRANRRVTHLRPLTSAHRAGSLLSS